MAERLATVRTVAALRRRVAAWRSRRQTVALVPTMGALHEGHLALARLARRRADRVVVSVFVNPTQFAPHEDFDSYPRDVAGDRRKLAATGADLVYAPDAAEMYPPGFATRVEVGGLTEGLCGATRPHFFGGVATVVTKLLIQCQPDMAVFGEKDFQQLKVIERLVRDLDLPVAILPAPIVREDDGLAMSSRNAYLGPEERARAPLLFRTIAGVARDVADGRPPADALAAGRARLESAGFRVDYLELREAETLAPLATAPVRPARVFAAVYLGATRLIDNVPVPAPGERAEAADAPVVKAAPVP